MLKAERAESKRLRATYQWLPVEREPRYVGQALPGKVSQPPGNVMAGGFG